MRHYIPTISNNLKKYPYLKETLRKDYYKFKDIPIALYYSLTPESKELYLEIEEKESQRLNDKLPIENKLAIICSCIGFFLCILGTILRHLDM